MHAWRERTRTSHEGLELALRELRLALRRLEDTRDERGRKAPRRPYRFGGAGGASAQGDHTAREEESP
jgi:hypothetical protein